MLFGTSTKRELESFTTNFRVSTSVGLNPSVTSSGIEPGLVDPLAGALSRSSFSESASTLTDGNLSLNNPRLVLRTFGYNAGNWRTNMHPRMLGDVNGDGRQDIVGFGNAGVYLSTSTGNGFTAPRLVLRSFGYNAGRWRTNMHPRMLADVNGDGRQDIVGFGNAGVYLSTAFSTGNGFNAPRLVLRSFGYNAGSWRTNMHPRMLADVNDDGKADIVGFGNAGVYLSTAFSTGNGFNAPRLVLRSFGYNAGSWRTNMHPRMLADVNGDGRQDIVGFGNAGVYLSTSTGNGFTAPRLVLRSFGYNAGSWRTNMHPRMLADVNGDGRQDIVGFGNAGVYLSTSTGNGFNAPRLMLRTFGYNAGNWRTNMHPRMLADVNGDGLADIVGFGNAGVYTSIARDWYGRVPNDANLVRFARLRASDGQLSRNDMIAILRNAEDYAVITSGELVDLRRIVSAGRSLMPDYVHNLSNKIVNGDPANAWWTGGAATRTALGDLVAGSNATRMERLIGKWFLGLDRPTASSDTTYQFASGSLFQGGISYSDIKQSPDFADCYFLASLAGTAFRSTSRIRNMFIDNGDGTYTVRFYNSGVADYVTVDRYLPVYSSGSSAGRFYYANGDTGGLGNELWVALAEKAYAQINESGWIGQDNINRYHRPNNSLSDTGINFGTPAAISHITGLTNTGYLRPLNTSELIRAYNASRIIYLSDGGHAYTLVGYNSSTSLFTVYNPYGHTETYTSAEMRGKFVRFAYSGSRV